MRIACAMLDFVCSNIFYDAITQSQLINMSAAVELVKESATNTVLFITATGQV